MVSLGKCHRSKWMMTGGTPVAGNFWDHALIQSFVPTIEKESRADPCGRSFQMQCKKVSFIYMTFGHDMDWVPEKEMLQVKRSASTTSDSWKSCLQECQSPSCQIARQTKNFYEYPAVPNIDET